MARYVFGGQITDLVVSEDTGNDDALVVAATGSVVTFYDAPGGTEVDDFLLWDGTGYTIAATEIQVTATGHLPAFQGPDGVTELYDANGQLLRTRVGVGDVTQADLDDALAGKADDGHIHDDRYYTQTEVDTALGGKAGTGHTHDDRYYTQTEVDDLLAAAGVTGTYRPALRVYESSGTLVDRATVTTDPDQPVEVILELGSTINPYDVTHGYVAGFDTVGKTVPA